MTVDWKVGWLRQTDSGMMPLAMGRKVITHNRRVSVSTRLTKILY